MSRELIQGPGPVFIHSLFRSGSTYLFSVFQRVPGAYYCFQEALHEVAVNCRNSPSAMLEFTSSKYASTNRHPHLLGPYFKELYDTRDAWMRVITKPMVYDDYFASTDGTETSSYFAALAAASPRRPVFQECRTCGRIAALKEKLGGFHVYLWRNPWDQWWSYKATDYFEIAQLLIINAINPPAVILALRREIGFEPWHHDAIGEEFDHFSSERPAPADSYLVFYILWCLCLLAGSSNADMMINIDSLSEIPEARAEATTGLVEAGVTGIDFHDCRITQAMFSAEEAAFFEAIEARAHYLLVRCGTSASQLATIRELRERHRPATQSAIGKEPRGNDLSPRAFRDLIQRIEAREYDRMRKLRNAAKEHGAQLYAHSKWLQTEWDAAKQRIEELSQRTGRLESELESERQRTAELDAELRIARARESELQTRAQRLQNEWDAAQAKIDDLNQSSRHWWTVADELNRELQGVYASKSWRITKPFRATARLLRAANINAIKFLLLVSRSAKTQIERTFRSTILYVRAHPYLKARAAALVSRFPGLKAKLRSFAFSSTIPVGTTQFLTETEVSQKASDIYQMETECTVDRQKSSFGELGKLSGKSELAAPASISMRKLLASRVSAWISRER